jgi:hypothetical protein
MVLDLEASRIHSAEGRLSKVALITSKKTPIESNYHLRPVNYYLSGEMGSSLALSKSGLQAKVMHPADNFKPPHSDLSLGNALQWTSITSNLRYRSHFLTLCVYYYS